MFKSYRWILKFDQNLRRLHLNIDLNWFNPKILNSLIQLEHLEIETGRFWVNKCTLTLPNLKIFKNHNQFQYAPLKMKTPKLEALVCLHLDTIEIDQPETIKHLRTERYHSSLEKFINLEVLECGNVVMINKEVLSSLSNLKVLCCFQRCNLIVEERRNLINKMSFIMKQKLVLRKTELKVYLQGVQLTNDNNLNTFGLDVSNIRFQIENYANLYNNLFFISCVNYSHLTELMKQVPDDYFNKFFQIHTVKVTTKLNRDHFISFVNKLNFVECFVFNNASLDQTLVDYLLDFFDLKILLVIEVRNLNLNFDCILKHKRLIHFETNQSFQNSFDLAIKAFSRLTRLKFFGFKKDDETVGIHRRFIRFDLYYRDSNRIPTRSKHDIELNELIAFCNLLANKTGVQTRSATKLIDSLFN